MIFAWVWRGVKLAWWLRKLRRPTRVRRSEPPCKWRPNRGVSGESQEPVDYEPGYDPLTGGGIEHVYVPRFEYGGLEGQPWPAGQGWTADGKSPLDIVLDEIAGMTGSSKPDLMQRRIDSILTQGSAAGPVLRPEFRERAEHLVSGHRGDTGPMKCLCVRFLPERCPEMAAPGRFTCAVCSGDCVVVTSGLSARHAIAPDYEFTAVGLKDPSPTPRSLNCPSCRSGGRPRHDCDDPWHLNG